MPLVVHHDIGVCMAKVPLIHFWIISHHYPDRVMRQFRFFQYIPPPAPLSWHTNLTLDNVDHSSKPTRKHWRIHWQIYVDEWADVDHRLVYITGPYDIHFRSDYMRWYESDDTRTVFFERNFVADLD
jgi:Plant mobile domain